jgi:beta-galactosidase/beta-glucuronidase
MKNASLMTEWSKKLDPEKPLPEYPRPQWRREQWVNLNGRWEYAITKRAVSMPEKSDGTIIVPFGAESALSDVMRPVLPSQRLWYRRTFILPEKWGAALFDRGRILLHCGAIDWEATIWVNNTEIGTHRGGYTPFTFDITNVLLNRQNNANTMHEIKIGVWDPTDRGNQERGKQVLHPFGVNYTPITGIWQTIWLEMVPQTYIESCRIIPDIDTQSVTLNSRIQNAAGQKADLRIKVTLKGKELINQVFPVEDVIRLSIPEIELWSPDTPTLYDIRFELMVGGKILDEVESYFGMRHIGLKKDVNGILRLALNHQIVFQYGSLDQGYWPDGLYTAPTDEALRFDIELQKKLGFNMIRKHIKVEPARWYYHCDTIGILVWQDMPSGGSQAAGALSNFALRMKKELHFGRKDPAVQAQYFAELEAMIKALWNHPSIVMWVPFNEGWGQFRTEDAVALVRQLDTTRLVNNASGWTDHRIGDVHDIHTYPGPDIPPLEDARAVVCGEFGGLGFEVPDHLWKIKFKWGYRKFKTAEALEGKYTQLMEKLKELKIKGLSAAVYTQITDVEGEINGLYTYDRKIAKIPPEKLVQQHHVVIHE